MVEHQSAQQNEMIFLKKSPHVTEVLLNNSKKMNYLNLNMLCLMIDKMVEWNNDK